MNQSNHPHTSKPQLNEAARIVNSHFLQTPYEGKDWESVRKDIIDELTAHLNDQAKQLLQEILSVLDDLYNPEITDLELEEHHGSHNPVVYLSQVTTLIKSRLEKL